MQRIACLSVFYQYTAAPGSEGSLSERGSPSIRKGTSVEMMTFQSGTPMRSSSVVSLPTASNTLKLFVRAQLCCAPVIAFRLYWVSFRLKRARIRLAGAVRFHPSGQLNGNDFRSLINIFPSGPESPLIQHLKTTALLFTTSPEIYGGSLSSNSCASMMA